jgi:hypothetical protein
VHRGECGSGKLGKIKVVESYMLERALTVPSGSSRLHLEIGSLKYRPCRLQVFVDDDNMKTEIIGAEDTINTKEVPPNADFAVPNWTTRMLTCRSTLAE